VLRVASIIKAIIALMKEAVRASEMSVYFCETALRHIPKALIFIITVVRTLNVTYDILSSLLLLSKP
jgi:hypothetical protein